MMPPQRPKACWGNCVVIVKKGVVLLQEVGVVRIGKYMQIR